MNVSIDGMRKNMNKDGNRLKDVIDEILKCDELDDFDKLELKSRFDNLSNDINMFFCCYDDNVKNDFSDLSDLNIQTFWKEEEDF